VFETLLIDPFGNDVERNIAQVEVSSVERIEDYVEVYDPAHPDADEDGFVTFPDINILEEMVDMMTTTRSYEANLKVVDLTREMALKAIELGR
jgi:flagellar basal-body rod protein FlgC